MVKTLLEGAGYLVHCAENPDEALELLLRIPRPCILLWDAMTPRRGLAMLDRATLEGVHVATLPVSVAAVRVAESEWPLMVKRLVSEDAILSIVQAYCPLGPRRPRKSAGSTTPKLGPASSLDGTRFAWGDGPWAGCA